MSPDVLIYICHRSAPREALPRQWTQNGLHVVVHEVPCSGKIDGQYLMHAFEGGARGVCVIACPKGECRLNQGNYRAQIRTRTIQRLLDEAGLKGERIELIHCSADDPPEHLSQVAREFVERICSLDNKQIDIEKTISSV